MEAIKPALAALEALISDVENSIMAKKADAKQSNAEAAKDTSVEAPKALNSTSAASDNPPAETPAASAAPKAEKKKKKEKKPKQPVIPAVAPEIAHFLQCDFRVGRIISVSEHPEADGLYVLQVAYADEETKTVCAGLRKFLTAEEMANRMVVTICNLKPRKLRGVPSEAMILAGSVVSDDGGKNTVVPIAPPAGAQPGDVVGAQGIEGERTVAEGKYVSSKTWDKVVPRLGVKDETASYDGKPLTVAGGVVGCKLPDGAEIH